jgi:hypothetical protein
MPSTTAISSDGVGKELVSRHIHGGSTHGSAVSINTAALLKGSKKSKLNTAAAVSESGNPNVNGVNGLNGLNGLSVPDRPPSPAAKDISKGGGSDDGVYMNKINGHHINGLGSTRQGSLNNITATPHNVAALSKSLNNINTSSTSNLPNSHIDKLPTAIRPSGTVLGSLIDDLNLITALDDDHVPTRVTLARLYLEKGDKGQAEYWYDRACKYSKSRGSGCGSIGLSTVYGGMTGSWGFESWSGLGRLLSGSERHETAAECLLFAVKLERVSPLRGFQCLRRV